MCVPPMSTTRIRNPCLGLVGFTAYLRVSLDSRIELWTFGVLLTINRSRDHLFDAFGRSLGQFAKPGSEE